MSDQDRCYGMNEEECYCCDTEVCAAWSCDNYCPPDDMEESA